MGRPSGFERGEVLDRAMDLFWRTGYNATSIPELEAATGLGRGSIYNAFGDKEGLFVEVLERYRERYGTAHLAHLAHERPREGIRLMLSAIVDRMARAKLPPGCLVANTIVECDATGPKIQAMMRSGERALETAFRATIVRGIERGDLPPETDATAMAQYFAAVTQGLAVVHRASRDVKRLRNVIDTAMAVWPAPSA